MSWLVGVDDWLDCGQQRNNGKIELDAISTEERLRHVNFVPNFYRTTEFYNGRTAKRQQKNGDGMVETGR